MGDGRSLRGRLRGSEFIAFWVAMSEHRSQLVDERSFAREVLPFFEEQCRLISAIAGADHRWKRGFESLRLTVINNLDQDGKSYLAVSRSGSDHQFLLEGGPRGRWRGFSTDVIQLGLIKLHIVDVLRQLFVSEIVARASSKHVVRYVERFLKANYAQFDSIKGPSLHLFRVTNLQFCEPPFEISAYRLNIAIPHSATLDANEIKDSTADNKKVVISQRVNIGGFRNFDFVMGKDSMTNHIASFAYTDDLQLYVDVLPCDRCDLLKVVEHLRTTGSLEMEDLKRELLSMEYSKGPRFEKYLNKLLTTCFSEVYPRFDLRVQVENFKQIRRRDFVLHNLDSTDPFLRQLEVKGVEFLLFDAKNYASELTTRHLDTFCQYIQENDQFGGLGIVLSRKGGSANCRESTFRWWLKGTARIIVLDELDIMLMLSILEKGRSPIEVLREKYIHSALQQ